MMRKLGLAIALLAALYAFSGCNESTMLGSELIPGSDYVNALDTTLTNIITHNILQTDSSVFTGRANYGKVLGAITDDALFGRSHGIVYTQVSLPSAAFKYQGTGQTLDSVVLALGFSGYYGDSLSPQTFRVYRMNEPDFRIDSNYRYYQALGYDPGQLLGTATVVPRALKDSAVVTGEKQPPQLRIRLSNSFGNELLQQTPAGSLATDSAFRAWLKGFAIVPDTTQPTNRSMLYLDLSQEATRLTVYYRNTENDSLTATFPFNVNASAHANYFAHNYNGALAAQYINTSRPQGDSLLFLNNGPGLFTKVTIPGLDSLPLATVNKAELVVTQVIAGTNDRNAIYTEPDYLFLQQYTSGDTTKPLIDYGDPSNPNQPYFGGEKTEITNFGGVKVVQYKFNIARYVQYLLRRQETNNGFRLRAVSSRNIDVHRVLTGGGGHSLYNIKLRIIYTKL